MAGQTAPCSGTMAARRLLSKFILDYVLGDSSGNVSSTGGDIGGNQFT
jgi:hypothetical protein